MNVNMTAKPVNIAIKSPPFVLVILLIPPASCIADHKIIILLQGQIPKTMRQINLMAQMSPSSCSTVTITDHHFASCYVVHDAFLEYCNDANHLTMKHHLHC